MIQALQSILGLLQTLIGGGTLSDGQMKDAFKAGLAVVNGYLATVQPVAGNPAVCAIQPGVTEPADPDNPNSSAGFTLQTVPVPYATVAAGIKKIAAQTQNEQWASGFATAISLLSMIGGAA